MYNMAAKSHELALAIARGIKLVDDRLILLGLAGSELVAAAEEVGLTAAQEVFADRAYQADGTLVPRSQPGAVITDEEEAIRRVIGMVRHGTVTAITGEEIAVQADSACLHGDGAKAVLFAQKLHEALEAEGVAICPMKEVV